MVQRPVTPTRSNQCCCFATPSTAMMTTPTSAILIRTIGREPSEGDNGAGAPIARISAAARDALIPLPGLCSRSDG
jgi:hypothetical protein